MAPARELSFHVADLPAEGMAVSGEVAFAALDLEADAVFSFPQPLHFELNLAPVQDGVLVRGRLQGRVARLCDRCLEPGEVRLEVPDVCHHLEEVTGTVINLTDLLREDILLAFPQSWLCAADCRGLCSACGQNLNEADCGCVTAANAENDDDDAWGALDHLRLRDGG
jgi:uncharacterized protein